MRRRKNIDALTSSRFLISMSGATQELPLRKKLILTQWLRSDLVLASTYTHWPWALCSWYWAVFALALALGLHSSSAGSTPNAQPPAAAARESFATGETSIAKYQTSAENFNPQTSQLSMLLSKFSWELYFDEASTKVRFWTMMLNSGHQQSKIDWWTDKVFLHIWYPLSCNLSSKSQLSVNVANM